MSLPIERINEFCDNPSLYQDEVVQMAKEIRHYRTLFGDPPTIERDGQLPEWVGKMMNRRGIVEDTLRLPFTNNLKGLPPPDWYPPDAAKLVELANKLAVPEEFSPAQFDTKTKPA